MRVKKKTCFRVLGRDPVTVGATRGSEKMPLLDVVVSLSYSGILRIDTNFPICQKMTCRYLFQFHFVSEVVGSNPVSLDHNYSCLLITPYNEFY